MIINLSYLVRVHNKHSLPVDLLHLIRCDQICHVDGFPAGLSLPQDRVQCGEQRSDVPLLPLDPIEDLTHEPSSSSSPKHMYICSWGNSPTWSLRGSMPLDSSCFLISAIVLGIFLSVLEPKPCVDNRSSKSSRFTLGFGPKGHKQTI